MGSHAVAVAATAATDQTLAVSTPNTAACRPPLSTGMRSAVSRPASQASRVNALAALWPVRPPGQRAVIVHHGGHAHRASCGSSRTEPGLVLPGPARLAGSAQLSKSKADINTWAASTVASRPAARTPVVATVRALACKRQAVGKAPANRSGRWHRAEGPGGFLPVRWER